LLTYLGGDALWQSHTAWQQIVDRHAAGLSKDLEKTVRDAKRQPAARIQSLWALEGLKRVPFELLPSLLADNNRNIRREAVRVLAGANLPEPLFNLTQTLINDPDPEVRAELIRSAGRWIGKDDHALELLLTMARESLAHPLARNTQNGQPMKVREAYDREFERYLIRWALEKYPSETQGFLASDAAAKFPLENRLLATLALEPKTSASLVARLLPQLKRVPNDEELLRLAEHLEEPGVSDALKAVLMNPAMRASASEALLRGRTRFDTSRLTPILTDAATSLLDAHDAKSLELVRRLASGFKLTALEPQLVSALRQPRQSASEQIQTLRALREMGSAQIDLFADIAKETKDSRLRDEALAALVSSGSPQAADGLFSLWPKLNRVERQSSLERLASSKTGAETILASAKSGALAKQDLEASIVEKLLTLLGDNNADLNALLSEIGAVAKPVLRLDGRKESYVESGITLEGAFTVETWIRLDPGISNDDGILGRPGGADFNFFEGRFRVYGGLEQGDRIIAKRKMTPDLWTHVAVTRESEGNFKIYLDGELDQAECRPLKDTFSNLDIGRVAIPKGTGAMLAEYRIWNRCRTADEIRADFDRSFELAQMPVAPEAGSIGGTSSASPPITASVPLSPPGGEGQGEGVSARPSSSAVKCPPALIKYFPGGANWGRLMGTARVIRTLDPPPVLTAEEARVQAEKLAKYRTLAERPGDIAHGKQLSAACLVCHTIQAQGGNIGPNLSGAGAMNLEALLRSVLTPNAAMEAGYRVFRVELNNDEILDGFLVSQDANAVILRIPNSEDRRIPKTEIRRSYFIRRSLMPEGLLESLPDRDATDLLTYLRSLR